MDTVAVILERPEHLRLQTLPLTVNDPDDLIIDVAWSGISTGTERLLYSGRMPDFPGMGYPLVPGYETVGRVSRASPNSHLKTGDFVFVPGANCFGSVRGLFGGAASRLAIAPARAVPIAENLGASGILLALAATAHHAVAAEGSVLPELIVGHGILGRLMARIILALGGPAPTVWERQPQRRSPGEVYPVIDPEADSRRDYRSICDASGDAALLDELIRRLAKRGEVVLAGFYEKPLSFAFPPAFMREARIRVAAEWSKPDMEKVCTLIAEGRLSLDGLISHQAPAHDAEAAYRTAFGDPQCLKMVLDWSAQA